MEDSEEEKQRQKKKDEKFDPNVKLLRPGAYFGEISIIFGCQRTA